jgi:hypothetical protein
MVRITARSLLSQLVVATLVLTGLACSEDDSASGPHLSLNNCESCHTNATRILATADPEPPESEDPGEG